MIGGFRLGKYIPRFDLPSLEKYVERDSVEKSVFVVLIEKIRVNLGLRMFIYIR